MLAVDIHPHKRFLYMLLDQQAIAWRPQSFFPLFVLS